METAGLVIGGVSLASLFTTCVDCFEYVQLGRQFGKDYQTATLKLDLIKLRLSRWANAVNTSGYSITVQSEDEITKVKEVLGQIVYLFQETEKKSERFRVSKGAVDEKADLSLDEDIEAIHLKMRNLALKRQKRSSFTQKAAWALSEEKFFRRLIEDVDPLVRDLVDMFPAAKEQQEKLSIEEAYELQTEKAVTTLQDANEGEDELLQVSLTEAMAGQVKHSFLNNSLEGEVRARYGDEIAPGSAPSGLGSMYGKNSASGKVTVHYGDSWGHGSMMTPAPTQGESKKPESQDR